MRIVFTSYVQSPQFTEPKAWLDRIKGYVGILEHLSKMHEVMSIEQINFEGRYQMNGVDYRFLRIKNTLLPTALHNYIKDLDPDVVFVHGMHFPLQVIQLNRKLGKKVRLFIQNHAEKPATGIKRVLQRVADKNVDGYFFTSLKLGEPWLRNKIISDEKKIHEVMEASSVFGPANKDEARRITGMNGNPVFIWVGRLDVNKDPLTVVNAFKKFLLHQPGAHLYMLFHTEELKDAIIEAIEHFQSN